MRTFDNDLIRNLKDPEFAAYFTEAQIDSAKELLKKGVIQKLTVGSMKSKTKWINWRSNERLYW